MNFLTFDRMKCLGAKTLNELEPPIEVEVYQDAGKVYQVDYDRCRYRVAEDGDKYGEWFDFVATERKNP